jgi:hypothetical protein
MVEYVTAIVRGEQKEIKQNPHRAAYIHLTNLHTLFEFCLPSIQDYGCTLKGNDWPAFLDCFTRLLFFFMSCSTKGATKGASDYYRSMLVYHHLMRYWIKEDLPIAELLRANHTIFSEESGEIALSVLVHSQPPSDRADIKQTRKYWHLTRQRYVALHSGQELPRVKKHRFVGNALLIFACQYHNVTHEHSLVDATSPFLHWFVPCQK